MAHANIIDARRIAQYAPDNISLTDATKLCKSIGPQLDEFQTSSLADMVCRFAKQTT